jgi:hypothetical protein
MKSLHTPAEMMTTHILEIFGLPESENNLEVTCPSGAKGQFHLFFDEIYELVDFHLIALRKPDVREVHANDIQRLKKTLAALQIPLYEGEPIARVSLGIQGAKYHTFTPEDIAWMRSLLERHIHISRASKGPSRDVSFRVEWKDYVAWRSAN